MTHALDEEALAAHVAADERRQRGVFFTPAEVVQRVLAALPRDVAAESRLRVIDPACGAGAFLSAAATRWPEAELWGVELNAESARLCRARVPHATIREGNALVDDELLPPRDGTFELWLGNPPWNGTSPLLREPNAWARACSWLPRGLTLQRGTSLRDDFVFFLLLAARRLEEGPGALAFVTSATLLDAFAHAPVRQALLSRLKLQHVELLPRGTFTNTRVEPCITVWTTSGRARVCAQGTEWNLRPLPSGAEALDARWRRTGAPLEALVPVSFAGLKTRFDELLVDDSREVLEARVAAFLEAEDLREFARRFGLTEFLPKLAALREFAGAASFTKKNVRRFLRYRGPNPMGKKAWCYVDRQLIPRGDHRMRGAFDPHAQRLKLVFNVHELPLAAHVIDEPGCVTMYRHSRFAPALVPRALLTSPTATDFDADDLVPNLTTRALALGSPREVFSRIATHIMSPEFQDVWAPAFGTSRSPLIALRRG